MSARHTGMSNFRAGVIALVLIAVGTYLGFTKGDIPFVGHKYEVKAVFASAASEVRKGSPVRIAGVNVGKVSKVQRGEGTTALVTMTIDDAGRPVHTDAVAKIRPRLFLEGNFFVDLSPGTPGRPQLSDGGTIPLSQTKIPVQVDEVLNTLQDDSRQDLRNTVKGLAGAFGEGGGEAFRDLGKDGPAALANTAVVMDAALGERPGELSRFINRAGQISAAVATRESDLSNLISAFATTTTTLAERRSDVDASLTALDRTLRTARPGLASLRSTMPALTRFARGLDPALDRLPSAITALRPFVREAGRLVSTPELPAFTDALGPAVDRLSAAQPGLTTLLRDLRPVARCVARNVVPTLQKSVDDGHLSTGQPAWQELAHLGVGLSAAGESFDGNGHAVRYNVGASESSFATGLSTTLTEPLAKLGQQLFAFGPEISGARPRWTPNTQPPFNASQACETQDLPDLKASSAPAVSARRTTVSPGKVASAVRTAVKRDAKLSIPQLRAKLRTLAAAPPRSTR